MNCFTMYLITRLDTIIGVSIGVLSASALFLLLLGFWLIAGDEDEKEKAKKYTKPLFIFIIVSIALICLVPTTKDVAAIYLVPKIVNNEEVQKIPENAAKFLNVKLEQWIKDSLIEEKESK